MKNKGLVTMSMSVGLAFSLLFACPAHAYLDPGSGSAILQGILAGIVAVGLTVKLFWHKLLKFLGIRKDSGLDKKDADVEKN